MKIIKKLCLIILTILCVLFGAVNIVRAVNGPGGRNYNYGYFYNGGPFLRKYEYVLVNGITGHTGSKDSFISYIEDLLNNGSAHDKTGAAFIIQTMRGSISHGKPVPGTVDGDIDISDWKSRILNSKVTIKVQDYNYSWNSGYIASASKDGVDVVVDDAAYLSLAGKSSSLVFMYDGIIKFAIKIDCANPVGDLPGLPTDDYTETSWSVTPQVYANYDRALPGTTITWKYTVKNNGPDPTDKDIKYNYAGSSIPDHTAYAPLASGDSNSFTSDTIVPDDAPIGSKICRTVTATPSSSSDPSSTEPSPPACVTVIGSPPNDTPPFSGSANGCAPINVYIGSVRPYADSYPYNTFADYLTINVSIGSKSYSGSNPPTSSFDVTNDFTDGDSHTVYFSSDSYIYGRSASAIYRQEIRGTSPNTYMSQVFDHWDYSPKWRTVDYNRSIGPCYNYNLKPSVSAFTGIAEAGQTINVNSNVLNSDSGLDLPLHDEYPSVGATKSASTEWALTQLVFKSGNTASYTNNGNGGYTNGFVAYDNLCGNYDYFISAGSGNCSTSHTVGNIYDVGNTSKFTYVDVGDYAAGTKLCYVESLRDYSSGSHGWRHSAPSCITVGKKPKAQIWGGDLSVGRAFGTLLPKNDALVKTSASTKTIAGDKKTFGSWIEYGIFAPGTITGAASGSAFAVGLTNVSSKCNYSTLSFTNTSPGSTSCTGITDIGKYNSLTATPDVEASFSGGTPLAGDSIAPNNLSAGGVYTYDAGSGLLNINASTLAPGKSIILKVTGKVEIMGDQKYNIDNNGAGYKNVSQLPQLVIIADNIYIAAAVSNVDAWLIARDGLNTCSAVNDIPNNSNEMDISTCNKQLVINGPVMAGKLYLNRTYGAGVGNASGDPAEIFNLRADAYLWAYNRASGSGHMQTVYSTELPVRL